MSRIVINIPDGNSVENVVNTTSVITAFRTNDGCKAIYAGRQDDEPQELGHAVSSCIVSIIDAIRKEGAKAHAPARRDPSDERKASSDRLAKTLKTTTKRCRAEELVAALIPESDRSITLPELLTSEDYLVFGTHIADMIRSHVGDIPGMGDDGSADAVAYAIGDELAALLDATSQAGPTTSDSRAEELLAMLFLTYCRGISDAAGCHVPKAAYTFACKASDGARNIWRQITDVAADEYALDHTDIS